MKRAISFVGQRLESFRKFATEELELKKLNSTVPPILLRVQDVEVLQLKFFKHHNRESNFFSGLKFSFGICEFLQ